MSFAMSVSTRFRSQNLYLAAIALALGLGSAAALVRPVPFAVVPITAIGLIGADQVYRLRSKSLSIWAALAPALFLLRFPTTRPLFTFDRAWIALVAVVALLGGVSAARRHDQSMRVALSVWGLATAAIAFLGGLDATRLWIDSYLLPILLALSVLLWVRDRDDVWRIAGGLAVAGSYLGALGIAQRVAGFSFAEYLGTTERFDIFIEQVRVSGVYQVPEPYAFVLNVCLAATMVWALSHPRTSRRTALAVIAVACELAGIYLTFFRAAWVSAAATLIIFSVFRSPRRRRYGVVVVGLAVISSAYVLSGSSVSSSDVYQYRLSNVDNIDGRVATWMAGADLFWSAPIIGVGLENYPEVQRAVQKRTFRGVRSLEHPHSSFVSILAEQGIVGFATFALVMVALVRRWWRSQSRTRTGFPRDWWLCAGSTLLTGLIMSATLTMISYGMTTMLVFLVVLSVCGVEEGGSQMKTKHAHRMT